MNDRTALVTGASQGIGRACAKALAARGATVVVGARQSDKLTTLVEEIRAEGGSAEAIALDVRDQASVDAMVAAYGKAIDVLVNNAGIARDGLAMRLRDADWERVIDTNLTGSFRCARALMRHMARRRWGRIINVSSVVGLSGNAGQANYSASKAGIVGLTKSLALELAGPKRDGQCGRAWVRRYRHDPIPWTTGLARRSSPKSRLAEWEGWTRSRQRCATSRARRPAT